MVSTISSILSALYIPYKITASSEHTNNVIENFVAFSWQIMFNIRLYFSFTS